MADWRQVVRRRLAELRLTPAAEAELTDEIAQHLEDLYRDLQGGGATPEAAYARTISELDDIGDLRRGIERSQRMPRHEAVPAGDAISSTWMNDLQRDLRYTGRAMRSNPVFVLFVVVVLGLGIGANTAVFTVINTLLLNPMPVAAPSELVAVASVPSAGSAQANTLMPLSHPNFEDYEAQTSVFDSLAGYVRMRGLTWQSDGATQGFLGDFVTGKYFSVDREAGHDARIDRRGDRTPRRTPGLTTATGCEAARSSSVIPRPSSIDTPAVWKYLSSAVLIIVATRSIGDCSGRPSIWIPATGGAKSGRFEAQDTDSTPGKPATRSRTAS